MPHKVMFCSEHFGEMIHFMFFNFLFLTKCLHGIFVNMVTFDCRIHVSLVSEIHCLEKMVKCVINWRWIIWKMRWRNYGMICITDSGTEQTGLHLFHWVHLVQYCQHWLAVTLQTSDVESLFPSQDLPGVKAGTCCMESRYSTKSYVAGLKMASPNFNI